MIVLITAMFGVILFRITMQWLNDYQTNLASVNIQDPSINNYVSNVSVIRYFLYENSSGTVVQINGEDAIQGSTAYTNVSIPCSNYDVYIGTESVVSTVKDSTTNILKLVYDLMFIIVMLA